MTFTNDSHSEIIAKSAAVSGAFTQEMYSYLMSLFPTPTGFAALSNRLAENYSAFLLGDQGDPEKIKQFEADRKALNEDLNQLLGITRVAAVKDPSLLKSLFNLTAEKGSSSPVQLDSPHGFKVVFGPTGQLIASVTCVRNARGYQVWGCDGDPTNDANWKLIESSTKCKGIVLPRSTRGNFSLLRIRAIRSTGPGPWSNLVTLDPDS